MKKESRKIRALQYVSYLVLVRSMLKNSNFPSISPNEEKILQSILIDCCLEIKITDVDLSFIISDMSEAMLQQGLESLKNKGFINFEKPEKSIRYIKLTELAREYLSNMGSCIFHSSHQMFE